MVVIYVQARGIVFIIYGYSVAIIFFCSLDCSHWIEHIWNGIKRGMINSGLEGVVLLESFLKGPGLPVPAPFPSRQRHLVCLAGAVSLHLSVSEKPAKSCKMSQLKWQPVVGEETKKLNLQEVIEVVGRAIVFQGEMGLQRGAGLPCAFSRKAEGKEPNSHILMTLNLVTFYTELYFSVLPKKRQGES